MPVSPIDSELFEDRTHVFLPFEVLYPTIILSTVLYTFKHLINTCLN